MKPPNATSSKSSVTTRAARHRHERLSTNVRGQVTYRFTQPFRHGSAAPSALSITRNNPVSSDDSSNPLTEIAASLNIVRPSYADDLYPMRANQRLAGPMIMRVPQLRPLPL